MRKLKLLELFQPFVELVLAPSHLDDESDLDKHTTSNPITNREHQLMNRKLNALVRRANSFSRTNLIFKMC